MKKTEMASFRLSLAILACLLLAPVSVSADTIFLRNGRVHYGKIVNQTATQVLIQTERGTRTIAKASISRITYEAYEEAIKKERAAAAAARQRAVERARTADRLKREAEARRLREIEAARAAREAFRKEQAHARSQRAAFLREQVAKGTVKRKDIDEPIGFWDFAWRSLAVPGWGHIYMDRPVVGVGYSIGFIALAGRAVSARGQALEAKEANARETANNTIVFGSATVISPELRYLLAADANRRYLTEYQSKIDRYNASIASLALFYGLQLLHIIADGLTWESGGLFGALDPGATSGEARFELSVLPARYAEARTSSVGGRQDRDRLETQLRFIVTF